MFKFSPVLAPVPGLRRLPPAVATHVADQFQAIKNSDPCHDPAAVCAKRVVNQYTTALVELSGTPGKTAKEFSKIEQVLANPTFSTNDRVRAVRKETQATAKLLFTATALPAMWQATARSLPTWMSSSKFAIETGQCHRILGGTMNIARPIGDGVLFLGDAMNLADRWHDKNATTGQMARAVLDVGIDTTRLISYTLPQTPLVRTVAGVAMWARTGLGVYDVWNMH